MRQNKDIIIAKLRGQKGTVPIFNIFGDNNHDGIDAQIKVIEEEMTNDEIFDEWEDDEFILDRALEARNWLDGQDEDFMSEASVSHVADVERIIGIPSAEWDGRCYEIALKCLEAGVVVGKARYGQFLGKISEDCGTFAGRPFSQHGWVELPNGMIWDPTRWAFEATKPYIFIGPNNGEYDIGGNTLKRLAYRNGMRAPKYDQSKKQIDLTLDDADWDVVNATLSGNLDACRRLDVIQLHWVATADPKDLGESAKRIFAAIKAAGERVLIPIDNWQLVME